MRAKTWAPIATFVVVAAVGITVALSQDSGSRSPRVLKLATGSVAPAAAGSADYQLDVTLSRDKPPDQLSYTLTAGPAASDLVTRLAGALHAGAPVRDGDTWRAGGLVVSGKPGMAWSWSSCGTPPDAGGSSAGSGCAVGSISSGETPPPPVASQVVRDAAREVLAAVGFDVQQATIDTSSYGGSATLAEAGVEGMTTRVDVDRSGTITSAGGWLGAREPADRYPVISAKDAFASLPAVAHPDLCRIAPGGKGCLPPEPIEIVGAELGLSLQATTDGGGMLVPSWLFATKAGGRVVAVAVEPQYRATPSPPQDLPAPGNPGSVDPPAPQPKPTG